MTTVTFHDVAQNSEAWEMLRIGKITSSSYSCIMANAPKAFGEPAKRYALRLALERMSGMKSGESFSNSHTARGHEQEPEARSLYEDINICIVKPGGFFCNGYYGGSPDGLVMDDGLIEIKSVVPSIHYDNFRRDTWCPTKHWQMVGNLECTGRQWIDFISYCPEFPAHNRIVIRRMTAAQAEGDMVMLKERRQKFNELVEKIRGEIQEC